MVKRMYLKQNKAPQQCGNRTAKGIEIIKSIGEKDDDRGRVAAGSLLIL